MTYIPVKCECGCVFWSATSHCPKCNAPVKPQARPIDANALIAEQCGQCDGACEMFDGEKCLACKADCHCDLREAIDNAPTLDCEPVRHGEWIKETGMAPPEFQGRHKCSLCFHYALGWKMGCEELSPFCPNCGALMEGGKENDKP